MFITLAVGTMLVAGPVLPARGHGMGEAADPEQIAVDAPKAGATTEALLPPSLSDDGRAPARAVIDQMYMWDVGTTLVVCFAEPAPLSIRQRIARAANRWTENANLHFDWGKLDDPQSCDQLPKHDIGIGFKGPGASSYVGTDSLHYPTSMNLHGLDNEKTAPATIPREFDRIVLHEFGHAIGLEHEHQSPDAHCDEQIDWGAAMNFYTKKPMNWKPDAVAANLKPLAVKYRAQKDQLNLSAFDRASIMMYSLPAQIFKDREHATCWAPVNYELSPIDKAWVAGLYPGQKEQQMALKKAMLTTVDETLKQGGVPDEERKAAIQKIGKQFNVSFTVTGNDNQVGVNSGSGTQNNLKGEQNVVGDKNVVIKQVNGPVNINIP